MNNHQAHEENPELEKVSVFLVNSGLLDAGREEIEHILGQRLQQELLTVSRKGEQLAKWAQGTYGPVDLAKRFIEFQKSAIRAELCDPKGKGLKSKYAKLLSPSYSKATTIAGLAVILKNVLGISAEQAGVPAVALYTALWLFHTNLQHWCRKSYESKG